MQGLRRGYAGAMQGLCRGYAGAILSTLSSLKVVGAQRGSVLNFMVATYRVPARDVSQIDTPIHCAKPKRFLLF